MESVSKSKSGPYRATKLWNEVLYAFRDNMPIGRHRRNMRTYEGCFVASDAVDWLHDYLKGNTNFGEGVSRYQTVQLLQKFHKGQVFVDVRGSKHKEQFQDNGRLYRFLPKSPEKKCRTPLKCKKSHGNQMPERQRIKLDFDDINTSGVKRGTRGPESGLATCHLVAKQLSTEEVENVYRKSTLARLRKLLGVNNLDEILEMPKVHGCHVRHNLTYLNKTGIVTNISKEEQLPPWILSAMRCLAYWPEQGEESMNRYPGFERDVFRVVTDHFKALDEPLLTYEFYELFINVMAHVENPDPKRSTPRGNNTYGFSPMSHESFVSVENLVLSMASPLAQQMKLSQWNVSEINGSLENVAYVSPKHRTSSQPNLLDTSNIEDNACLDGRSFYDNFAFETTDSDNSAKLQRHYSSNNLDNAENYLANMTMQTRRPSTTSVCSSKSGVSTVSAVSGRSGRSAASHISGRSGFSMATVYSMGSGVSTATTRPDNGYSYSLARNPNASFDCIEVDQPRSYIRRRNLQEPPPAYRNPPPYLSVHRTASLHNSQRTPLSTGARSCLKQQRRHSTYMYSALWEHSSSLFDDTHETQLISALQVCCLLLPPSNKRKLHLLLRLMSKMVDNQELDLDDDLPVRTKVLKTFYRCIIVSAVEAEFDEQTSLCLVAFMMDHYDQIMTVPHDLKEQVERRVVEMQRAQVKYAQEPLMTTFCERVTTDEYEKNRLTNSEQAIADLLDTIVKSEKMAFKEKKKRLRQFQKEYPKIYERKFPDAESEAAVIPSKSKSRTPLLSGAINKLKTMRL